MNIPLLMIIAFVLLSLGVTLRTKQPTTFRAYAVGNKQFSTGYLVATLLATIWSGAMVIITVEHQHNYGLFAIYIFLLRSCLPYWLISKLALRMTPFMEHLSIAETIGSIYGNYARLITALALIWRSMTLIVLQISLMSQVISMCIDRDNALTITLLATFILILYTTIGGVHAVTVTDIMQLATFSMVLPLLYSWIWMQTGKPAIEVAGFLQIQEKLQFNNILFTMKPWAIILTDLVVEISNIAVNQRIYMSADSFQASRVFWISGIASLCIAFCTILISLFTLVAMPKLSIAEIWPYIIGTLSPAFKGFLAISLLAMIMSTADSLINSCAITFIHDVVDNLIDKKHFPIAYQLRLAKLTTLFIGILSLIISLYYKDCLQLVLSSHNYSIPITVAPFILAIFGFRSTSHTALIGMATGIATILAWNQWAQPSIPSTRIIGTFVGMIANGLAMVIAHCLGAKTSRTI